MSDGKGSGLTDAQFWVLVGVAILAFVLVLVDISMAVNNGGLREQTNARQQYINQSVKLANFHNQLVQGLAVLSARTDDAALRDLLARHGVTYTLSDQGGEGAPDQGGDAGTGQ